MCEGLRGGGLGRALCQGGELLKLYPFSNTGSLLSGYYIAEVLVPVSFFGVAGLPKCPVMQWCYLCRVYCMCMCMYIRKKYIGCVFVE